MSFGNQLRTRLEQSEILVIPGIYDCLSAKIAEQLGFEVIATSGFGIAASTLGLPDYGFLTATEMFYSIGRIVQSIEIPLIADLDTGYGNVLNVTRTVKDAVNVGISGIILEDQEWPKKCGHFEGKRVISTTEQIAKIKAAVEAKADSNLVIIGRTDARAPLGLDEAINRGKAYFEAGADVIFIEAPQSEDELVKIANALPNIPLVANIIEGGKTPQLSAHELQQLGFKIVFFPLSGLFTVTKAMMDCLRQLKETGTTANLKNLVSFQEFEKLIDVPKYRQIEQKFDQE
ncbi:2,3-dimethylmalate lyase [Lyngbya aestuarii BL J]|uniref:2,3-dimethylmalate lyase n=1 Tax=Lyngbya aestuarii BL J TaxID=1348334 RepID=U7QNW4_9CYAN|nr:oxaloacetate decarboxylase [Lyngbya aestuarii]ERT08091.1 2,3-dimethylmalate lyase [Lyngbya aestuarii BL J]